ncbi:hypothetical protein BKA62DRAFT_724168 [Auriculariales sp. MPI-PUGE-AT-0066]|nr:hypothetical protein BKA62DRAFT_724168 [Auriculariales sp. MPI-PUGE-AT-0066]
MPNGSIPLFTAFKLAGVVLFPAGDAPWQSSGTDEQSDGNFGTDYVAASFDGRRTTLQLWQPVTNASCIYFARALSHTSTQDDTTGSGELLLTGDASPTIFRILVGLAEASVTLVKATPAPTPTPTPTPSIRKALAKAIGALLGAFIVVAIIYRRARRQRRRTRVDGELTRPFTAYPTMPDLPRKKGFQTSEQIKLRPLAPLSIRTTTTLESPSTSKLSTTSLQPLISATSVEPSTPTTTPHRLLPVTPPDEGAFREFYNVMRNSGFTIQSLVQQLSPRRESFEREPVPDTLPDYGAAISDHRR